MVTACGAGHPPAARYVFNRLVLARFEHSTIRQTYVLSITDATLDITDSSGSPPLHWQGTAKNARGTVALDLVSSDPGRGTRPQWLCERVVTHVFAAGATLASRAVDDDACKTVAAVTPDATTEVEVLSCRDPLQPDPPPLDRAAERHRDANRWSFTPAPGLELVGDRCATADGALRQVR